MRLSNLIEGLQILQPYYDNPDGFHVGAEHYQFYAYTTDKPLPEEAVKRMVDLGWFQPDVDVDDGEYFQAKNYVADEGWSAHT
jgi:hypothetical protein